MECRVPGCPKRVNRPRGLCYSHYYAPGVRRLYPSLSKFAPRTDTPDYYGRSYPPPQPTAALPGSPEKIAALTERASQLVSLHHPRDGRVAL